MVCFISGPGKTAISLGQIAGGHAAASAGPVAEPYPYRFRAPPKAGAKGYELPGRQRRDSERSGASERSDYSAALGSVVAGGSASSFSSRVSDASPVEPATEAV